MRNTDIFTKLMTLEEVIASLESKDEQDIGYDNVKPAILSEMLCWI